VSEGIYKQSGKCCVALSYIMFTALVLGIVS